MENLNQFTKKTIKLYDELENTEDNIIAITESSNLKLGTGARVWETVRIKKPVTFLGNFHE